jgi:L-alanine-DL-glutamate epimerase-like enolase superfamily enzyme
MTRALSRTKGSSTEATDVPTGRSLAAVAVDHMDVAAFTIPTVEPESDGTLEWDSTTIIVVEVAAGRHTGIGYTYAGLAAGSLIRTTLADVVVGRDPVAIGALWTSRVQACRNQGRPGVVSSAISAVDIALWDLAGKQRGACVADLLGRCHDEVPVYGSGGFTSLSDVELARQLSGWVSAGIGRVKMKVGRDPTADPVRVRVARDAIGDGAELFVDANGAYRRKQALAMAGRFADSGVSWFEEPVSSDDLDGLRLLRDRAPSGMDIAAGEYGYDLPYFRRMLDSGAVDCLQADVTRCGGITAFCRVGALCDAHCLDLSSHTAPQVSAHACAGLWHLRHLEYFADHVRVESLLFDGVLVPVEGAVRPDRDRPGLGIDLKRPDAERFRR